MSEMHPPESQRQQPVPGTPVPPFPDVSEAEAKDPSVRLSQRRTEMSKRRTGMSFQRTRMSADRTLMSVIRTSLSLISFGFTIFQFFQKLREADLVSSAHEPRMFGMALVWLGTGFLVLGIAYHIHFMSGLRRTRAAMTHGSLIHGESGFPVSITLIAAVILLLIGILAITYMVS